MINMFTQKKKKKMINMGSNIESWKKQSYFLTIDSIKRIKWRNVTGSRVHFRLFYSPFSLEFDSALSVKFLKWIHSKWRDSKTKHFHMYVGMPELRSLKYWKEFRKYGTLWAKSDAAFGRNMVNSSSKSRWSSNRTATT